MASTQKISTKKQNHLRETNFELLRIIAMVMVVALHYMYHGGALKGTAPYSVNWFFSWIIEAFCIIAPNCYILVSGYFLINSEFKAKKLRNLWLQVLFYSISIYFLLIGFGAINFNIFDCIKSCMPVLLGRYWFATTYIVMYIFSPYLNIAIRSMDNKQMQKLIIIMFATLSIWPTFFLYGPDITGGYSIIQFVYLYFIASYIRLHWDFNIECYYYFLLYLLVVLLLVAEEMVILTFSPNRSNTSLLYHYNSVLVVLASICFFLFFRGISIKNIIINKSIVYIAGLTFGVYLISDNDFLRDILYDNILHTRLFYTSAIYIPVALGSTMAVFIVCIIIDIIRKKLFTMTGILS